jgi:hypothetical protein
MLFFGKAPDGSVIRLAPVVCCSGSGTGAVPSLPVFTAGAGEDAFLIATSTVVLLVHGRQGLHRAGVKNFLLCCTFLCWMCGRLVGVMVYHIILSGRAAATWELENGGRLFRQGRTERCDEDAGLAPKCARNMMAWWMDGAPPIYPCLVEDWVGVVLVLVLWTNYLGLFSFTFLLYFVLGMVGSFF